MSQRVAPKFGASSSSKINSSVLVLSSKPKAKVSGSSMHNSTMMGSSSKPSTSSLRNDRQPKITKPNQNQDKINFAYNKYLMACLKRKIIKDSIQQKMEAHNNQLAFFLSKVTDDQMKRNKLKSQIDEINKKKKLHMDLTEMRKLVDINKEALDTDVITQLDNLLEMLETRTSKLYLKDVDVLQDQKQYNDFDDMVSHCVEALKKFKENAGCIQQLTKLTALLEEMKQKQIQAQEYCDELEELDALVARITLKTASDMLA